LYRIHRLIRKNAVLVVWLPTPDGQLVSQIFGTPAEYERGLIREQVLGTPNHP